MKTNCQDVLYNTDLLQYKE